MKEKYQLIIDAIGLCLQGEQTDAYAKLDSRLSNLKQQFSNKEFFYLFAICPRWFSKQKVIEGVKKSIGFDEQMQNLDPFKVTSDWNFAQFARLYILLVASQYVSANDYETAVQQLFDTADVNELILLVQALPFIPESERFVQRAREAARSNMASVFSAVAHKSDFAYRYFDEAGWNQLILKAAFLAVPIWSIHGLRERNNRDLVQMLKNYVAERQAASRALPWDIWSCIAWLAESDFDLTYVRDQFANLDAQSQGAILLALQENAVDAARVLSRELHLHVPGSLSNLPSELSLSWQALADLKERK